MAKGSNLITHGMRGKLGNLQLVKDPRYGEYQRVGRGTLKPALLNEACKASSERLVTANLAAKAIYNAVRDEHKGYFLWNKLVSVFRKQLKAGAPFHLHDLKNMECHHEYKLEKLLNCSVEGLVEIGEQEGKLHIGLHLQRHPDWSFLKWKHDFEYRLSVVTVFPDLGTGSFVKDVAHGPVTAFTAPVAPLLFEVAVPEGAKDYLVFLLAAVCENGQASGLPRGKGMRVMGMGRILRIPSE
jgi:hypothetical protein